MKYMTWFEIPNYLPWLPNADHSLPEPHSVNLIVILIQFDRLGSLVIINIPTLRANTHSHILGNLFTYIL